MHFNILDTEATYRRLLNAPDAAAREAIFRAELVEPFMGIVQIFGGGDGVAAFAGWNMSPEQFNAANHAHMTQVVEALANVDAWKRAAQALDKGWNAFAKYADRVPLDSITFGLLLADLSHNPQIREYTGFGGIPGWIMTVYGRPDDYNLARIEAATVHELHHNLMGATASTGGAVAWDNMMSITVGEYMIGEGLAESFAAELYGADKTGPWVSEFDETDFERVKAIFRDGLNQTGFDTIRRYIFGDAELGIPHTAGYAIGYRVVQAYCQRTGKSVVDTSFVPAREIIAESGFFD